MRTDTDVRARIDTKTKKRAVVALKAMGLSISDAIRLLMVHVADERCLPFEVNLKSVKTGKRQPVVSASTTQRAAREKLVKLSVPPHSKPLHWRPLAK